MAASRPHFFALPVLSALAGITSIAPTRWAAPATAMVVVGVGWGAAQWLNDLLDLDTDRVNAPNRPIVSGRLPAEVARTAAAAAGVLLFAATSALHPLGWALALAGALLILAYNGTKRLALAGNVAFGVLIAITAVIGVAASLGDGRGAELVRAMLRARWTLATTAAIAAWYLQANYEKDRRGDAIAGYKTLAVLIGVRASAVLRASALVAIGLLASRLTLGPLSLGMLALSAAVGLYSTVGPMTSATDEAALRSYRSAVAASLLAMGSLSASVAPGLTSALVAVALAAAEAAFRRTENP